MIEKLGRFSKGVPERRLMYNNRLYMSISMLRTFKAPYLLFCDNSLYYTKFRCFFTSSGRGKECFPRRRNRGKQFLKLGPNGSVTAGRHEVSTRGMCCLRTGSALEVSSWVNLPTMPLIRCRSILVSARWNGLRSRLANCSGKSSVTWNRSGIVRSVRPSKRSESTISKPKETIPGGTTIAFLKDSPTRSCEKRFSRRYSASTLLRANCTGYCNAASIIPRTSGDVGISSPPSSPA